MIRMMVVWQTSSSGPHASTFIVRAYIVGCVSARDVCGRAVIDAAFIQNCEKNEGAEDRAEDGSYHHSRTGAIGIIRARNMPVCSNDWG